LVPGCDFGSLTNKLGVLRRVRVFAKSACYIHVRPSVSTYHRVPHWTDFHEIWYQELNMICRENRNFGLNWTKTDIGTIVLPPGDNPIAVNKYYYYYYYYYLHEDLRMFGRRRNEVATKASALRQVVLVWKKKFLYNTGFQRNPFERIPPSKQDTLRLTNKFSFDCYVSAGPESSFGIATCYGLDSPVIEFLLGRDIPHPSRPAPGPHPAHCTVGRTSLCRG
jgi:hypothetical protein